MAEDSEQKTAEDILRQQMRVSFEDYQRADKAIALSAFTAGLEIGFSVLLMGALYTLLSQEVSAEVLALIVAAGYPLGFVFVIIGRSELFTEQTALAIIPVLNGKASIKDLLILWGLIITGNLVGGALFALFLSWIGPEMQMVSPEAFVLIALKMTSYPPAIIFGSALLAGWMMGLLGWLLTSAEDSISRIVIVIFVTLIIGVGGLHHCIVGSVEVLCGLLVSDSITWGHYGRFLLYSVVGNVVGGAFFVSILKYSQLKLK